MNNRISDKVWGENEGDAEDTFVSFLVLRLLRGVRCWVCIWIVAQCKFLVVIIIIKLIAWHNLGEYQILWGYMIIIVKI